MATSYDICPDTGSELALEISAGALILLFTIMVLVGYKLLRQFAFCIGSSLGFAGSYYVIATYIAPKVPLLAEYWWNVGISIGVGVIIGGICVCLLPISVGLLGFSLGLFICSFVLATPLGPQLFDRADYAPLIAMGSCGMASLFPFSPLLLFLRPFFSSSLSSS
eukprot:TRINITY_DN4076_c0_g1_i2.p1 TRINITY_DN4076_c0_g1~~TRINITY_DN4076_c0_g1_i2.p1  ORF type:complete len:165 (+),score=34.86 TRINITY_DN4076_c0_g1_i2:55-549(+)